MSTATPALARFAPDRRTLAWAVLLVNTELLLVLGYLAAVGTGGIRRPLFFVYPFVWLNAAAWAVHRVDRPAASRRARLSAATVALVYFGVLAVAGGLVGPGDRATGLRLVLTSLPPGWSPALLYGGTTVQVALLPFKTVGYAALAYLVYVTALDTAGGIAGGLLGLFSCISCVLPVVAGVAGGFLGGGAALAAAAYGQSYGLSTAVFVLTVGLLTWRPTAGSLRRLWARR